MPSDRLSIHRIAVFLQASRQHLGLTPASSAAPCPPEAGRLQPMLRSLALIGSLGTALAQPALATETSQADMTPRLSATQEKCKP